MQGLAALADDSAYHTPYYIWAAVEPFAYFGVLGLFLRFGLTPLQQACDRLAERISRRGDAVWKLPVLRVLPTLGRRLWGGEGWGSALLFTWAFLLFLHFVFWPIVIYLGYFHELRFGMWRASLPRFLWEGVKEWGIGAFSLSLLVFGLYGLVRRVERWWLILGVVAAALLWVSSALDPFRSRVHHDQAPLPQGPLRTQLEALLRKAHVEFNDLVVEKHSDTLRAVQAYFAGQGPTRRIVLTDTLLSEMSSDEVAAVVAHEAGHVQELRWPGRVASSAAMVVFLYLTDRLLRRASQKRWFGIQSRSDVRTLPLVVGLFSLAAFVTDPLVGYFERQRELKADRFAVTLTGDPDAFERMLIRAGQLNRLDPNPPAFLIWMGSSHPSLSQRLLAVRHVETAKPSAEHPNPPPP